MTLFTHLWNEINFNAKKSKSLPWLCVCMMKSESVKGNLLSVYVCWTFISSLCFFSFERRMKRKRLSVIFLSLIDTDNWKTAFNQRLIAMDLQYSYIRFNGSQLAMLLNEKCMHFEPGCLAGWLVGWMEWFVSFVH